MDYRDKIIFNEMFKMIRESAARKAEQGLVLVAEQITPALVAFIAQYDLYVVFWKDAGGDRSLVIRAPIDEDADIRGNAAYVQDRATALALHAACRADDNGAPELPASAATPSILRVSGDNQLGSRSRETPGDAERSASLTPQSINAQG